MAHKTTVRITDRLFTGIMILVLLTGVLAQPVTAAIYTVDDDWQIEPFPHAEDTDGDNDFATIQAAIDAAASGDTINVAAGTYIEDTIWWEMKDLVIQGAGADVTVIDGCGIIKEYGSMLTTDSLTSASRFEGFTITNGYNDWDLHDITPTGWSCCAGMTNFNSSLTVANCIFSNNISVLYGGGMHNLNLTYGAPTVIDCIFSNNIVNPLVGSNINSPMGGGMYNYVIDCPTVVTNCTFTNNEATAGGGLYIGGLFDGATVTGCTFTDNHAIEYTNDYGSTWAGFGGGFYCEKGPVTVTGCTFSGNIAEGPGGGMYLSSYDSGTSSKLSNCIFVNNSADMSSSVKLDDLGVGGGLYLRQNYPDTVITLSNCIFTGNSASAAGGGVYSQRDTTSTTIASNCIFTGNSASHGGGVISAGGTTIASNCIFSGNNGAGFTLGGLDAQVLSSAVLTNCTFTGNQAPVFDPGDPLYPYKAAGIMSFVSDLEITNCILWNNSMGPAPGAPVEISLHESSLAATYSVVGGGTGQPWFGTGCLDTDPLFVDTYGRLSVGSPCINTGDNSAVPSWMVTDLDGNPRIFGAVVDMGAYESQVPLNPPPTADAGPDQTVELESYEGTEVILDGSASSDPDEDPLTYEWTWAGGSASGVNPAVILPLGTTTITLVVNDSTTDSVPDTVNITVVDTTAPEVYITFPTADLALQDVVTLAAEADDWGGVSDVYFCVREPDGGDGIPIGYEELPAAWNAAMELWELEFDTTVLPDGLYVVCAKAVDDSDNEGWSETVPFSIGNWAAVEFLPASKSNKAGRTMPVKFSLRIAEAVDPDTPFFYNEELEVKIYDAADPDTILQTSLYGETSKDYRINSVDELYITNFKTKKQPAEYVVEFRRLSNGFLIGSFTFETVK